MVELSENELKEKLKKIEEIKDEINKTIDRFRDNIIEELFAPRIAKDRIIYSMFSNSHLLGGQLCACYYELHRED